jgi:hypothetical protein
MKVIRFIGDLLFWLAVWVFVYWLTRSVLLSFSPPGWKSFVLVPVSVAGLVVGAGMVVWQNGGFYKAIALAVLVSSLCTLPAVSYRAFNARSVARLIVVIVLPIIAFPTVSNAMRKVRDSRGRGSEPHSTRDE